MLAGVSELFEFQGIAGHLGVHLTAPGIDPTFDTKGIKKSMAAEPSDFIQSISALMIAEKHASILIGDHQLLLQFLV